MLIGIEGSIDNLKLIAPEKIGSKIGAISIVELSADERKTIFTALLLIEQKLLSEEVQISSLPNVTLIFTEDGNFTIKNHSSSWGGFAASIIVYNMSFIRSLPHINYQFAVFLEELCHHFWNITDERIVKHKVREIVQLRMPQIQQLKELYMDGEKYE